VTLFALALVLAAAFVHASWNLLAKRAGDGGPAFVWLFNSLSLLIYAPLAVAVVVFQRPQVGPVELVFMLGSGVLHLGYFLLLQRGYGVGDLSLVYPLARGTGPLIATAAAIAFFGERPTLLALSGVILITAGVFLLTWQPGIIKGSGLNLGVAYGPLTGAT
jgi:drug/metabolite transporter (DMT)-like permease